MSAKLSPWAGWLVENGYKPLGLEIEILRQVETIQKEGAGDRMVEGALEMIVEAAKENSRRHGPSADHYVRQSVERLHLLNWWRGLARMR